MHYKKCYVNQNLFYALQGLHYVNKSKVTNSFRGIWYGLYFLAPFHFWLLLSIGKRSTLAKIWGTAVPPALPPLSPWFLRAWDEIWDFSEDSMNLFKQNMGDLYMVNHIMTNSERFSCFTQVAKRLHKEFKTKNITDWKYILYIYYW